MAVFEGKWVQESQSGDFEKMITYAGIPAEAIPDILKTLDEIKPELHISKDGETWTIEVKESIFDGLYTVKSGEEVEVTRPTGKIMKSKFVISEDKITEEHRAVGNDMCLQVERVIKNGKLESIAKIKDAQVNTVMAKAS